MHRYDQASEIMFFKRNKLKMPVPSQIAYAKIEQPTDDDLAWAKKTYKTPHDKLLGSNFEVPTPSNLWRTAFLITLPDHGRFQTYGLRRMDVECLTATFLCNEDINKAELCIRHGGILLSPRITKRMITEGSSEFIAALCERLPQQMSKLCKEHDMMGLAIERGDLDILQSINKMSPTSTITHKRRVDYALALKQSEVAKFLITHHEMAKESFHSAYQTLPTPEETWEKTGQNQVTKTSFFKASQQSLTEVFNFDRQEVTVTHHAQNQDVSQSCIEAFSDFSCLKQIEHAEQELQKFKGKMTITPHQPKEKLSLAGIKQFAS